MQETITTVTVAGTGAGAELEADPPAELLGVGAGLVVAGPDGMTTVTTTGGASLDFVPMLLDDELLFPESEAFRVAVAGAWTWPSEIWEIGFSPVQQALVVNFMPVEEAYF